jgi:anti-sigma regulatory factor (Ser/Thr protein kinase)
VLAHPDGSATMLDLPIDPPLGVRHSRPRRTTDIALPHGAVLCLYTDGLVERRTAPLDDRLELLRGAVKVDSPEGVCASVMRVLVGAEAPSDDIALLVVRVADNERGAPLDLRVSALPASLTQIRAALRRWLREAHATETAVHDILLAVGEATANAVEHAYGPAGGTISVGVELDGNDVVVRVSDTGRWRAPRGHGRGRGTLIMETTTDEFRVDRGSTGTEVVLRRRIDR